MVETRPPDPNKSGQLANVDFLHNEAHIIVRYLMQTQHVQLFSLSNYQMPSPPLKSAPVKICQAAL